MAKITRKLARIFGQSAGPTQIGQFGSLAAGDPEYSSDPDVIQQLSNWLGGWYEAVVGSNSPAIQDMNAFCYVVAYQIAYLLQTGVGEWNSGTTYYIGSLATDSTGTLFTSIANDNLNNALTDGTKWANVSRTSVVSKAANYTAVKGDALIQVSVTHNETLPDATLCSGLEYAYVKTDSNASTVTFLTQSAQTMSGLASGAYTLTEQWSFTRFRSNGVNWLIVGAG